MNRRVYLDNNATTPLDPLVQKEMAHALSVHGNPSSIHAEGREARAFIDDARVAVGRLLQCDHRQIVFTSGGTEANNLAVLGAARANADRGRHIITSSIEHSSILNACHQLESEGFEVTYVAPTPDGIIEPKAIAQAIRPGTILITIMMANNEVGTIQPITEIGSLAKQHQILFHTDAVQALGKIPVVIDELNVDLLSVSAHKIYGPKGVGALYHRANISVMPLQRGGTHENGLRPGTENAPAIHAFGVAASILNKEGAPGLIGLRQKIEADLENTSMKVICQNAPRLPNTINFYSDSWLGESMVMAFDLEGIAVSNGSACSSGIIESSHVIRALGYNEDVSRSVIRVSLGKFNTEQDIDYFLRVVHDLENRMGSRIDGGVLE
ncbi:MAG: cysteine desulfurase NifS [Acidobacteria bacterium]|nr:MAG: cysteine desulfurase NifS [Acidobacteriota bacterium]